MIAAARSIRPTRRRRRQIRHPAAIILGKPIRQFLSHALSQNRASEKGSQQSSVKVLSQLSHLQSPFNATLHWAQKRLA
jgi:hypothetical protein